MEITGKSIYAAAQVSLTGQTFRAHNPSNGETLAPDFHEATAVDVDIAVELADRDFDTYRTLAATQRAVFLDTIAEELSALKPVLVQRAHLETGLPHARLEGELGRTTNQLKLFADFLRKGLWLHPHIEPAEPGRSPVPKPDLRRRLIALGPTAVFGACNFPLAFSVAGGDTAAALAAGCPVVAKGHPAHPGTSELAARAIVRAAGKCGVPEGVFAMLQGNSNEVGRALVQHPQIKAVAFTGSAAGGKALFDLAAARAEPIPVFAEMGSINPVFLLPGALASGGAALVEKLSGSITLGVGQFCTKPGMLVLCQGPQVDTFVAALGASLGSKAPAPMLHAGIKNNYLARLRGLTTQPNVSCVAESRDQDDDSCFGVPVLLQTTAVSLLADPGLAEEVFGPSSLVVVCETPDEMLSVARHLAGQLTATLFAGAKDVDLCHRLLPVLERKAGRLLLNDVPTGVEVCHAMVHGGPYPATTDSRYTSVGTAAIYRFLRPVCYQNFTAELLPDSLKDQAMI